MKILITNGHLNVGGVEKSLVNLLNAIDYTKYEVDLLLLEGTGDYFEDIPQNVNVLVYDLRNTYGSFFKVVLNALRNLDFKTIYLKILLTIKNKFGKHGNILLNGLNLFIDTKKTYDCAIAYRVGLSAEYVAFAVKAEKKYIWWHHGEFNYAKNVVDLWNETLKKVDGMVCVSKFTKDMCYQYFPNVSFRIIPNMINPSNIISKSQEFNPFQDTSLNIVSIGRLSEEKHMIDCVYVMKILVEKGYNNVKWYLVGDGVEKDKICTLIKEFNLNSKVILVGSTSNPYPYMANADIFVHPSHVESQGITVLEALALNKKSVIVESYGINEYIYDKKNALVAKKNIIDLANKVVELIENGEKYDFVEYQNQTINEFLLDNIMNKFYELI